MDSPEKSGQFRQIPRVPDHITTRFLSGEAFIMNLKNLKTYSLNETAADIWSCIDGSRSIEEIFKKILSDYDISDTQCRSDVRETIEQFHTEELVIFDDPHE